MSRTRPRPAAAWAVCGALLLPLSAESAIYTTSYSYDVPNGIVTRTDPNGTDIAYHYNSVNRLSKVVLGTGGSSAELNYYYDLTDQLERQTYPGGEQLYTYDEFDRLQTVADFGTGPLLQFSYDHRDRVTWIVYTGSNGAVCYEYDPDGRITRVGRVFSGAGTVCSAADEKTDYGYDAQGRLSTLQYPNGLTGYVQYDEAGRIGTTGYRRPNGTLLYSDTFAYVPGSRLYASITRTTAADRQETAYTYDAWERLLTVTEPDGRKTEYEYDPFGNRTREKISNVLDPEATGGSPKAYGDYVYEYPAKSNRLSRILKDGVQLEAYTYDNAGRLTQRVHATEGTTTYAYDARGLVTQVTKPGTTIGYTYDALGARKSKTVNGTTTKYLTAPLFGVSRVIAELNDNLSLKATYVYGGQQLLKEEPTYNNRSHDLYLLSDGIVGSVTHATDSGGQVKDKYGYDAFGIRSTTSQTSNSHGHYGYTGQEYDEEAGLLYLRARYYDPKIGRFISADPFWGRLEEPASQNRYAYVHNNPLRYTDPLGLAYFAKRPLGDLPEWYARGGTNPIDNYFNTEFVHEQIFYEDGKLPSNQGFFGDNGAWNEPGVVRPDQPENFSLYWRSDAATYDDAMMRSAVNNVGPGNYCLFGANCQDWADKVRQEYQRLLDKNSCP